jgi:beta-lactamase class A
MIPLVLFLGAVSCVGLALDAPARLAPPPADPPGKAVAAPAHFAPQALQAQLDALGAGYGDRAGIAVRDVQAGWTAHYDGDAPFPQQSVSKLWVAISVLDAVDRGGVKLDQPVTIRPEDLSLFHQPIRKHVLAQGVYTTTPADLLEGAITQSDNAANDALSRLVGGPPAIRAVLRAKALEGVTMGPGERVLQTQAAGLDWRPEYSVGRVFWEARAQLPDDVRGQAFYRYLLNPPDAASPRGVVTALAKLHEGELLSSASTARLLDLMAHTQTGASRLRSGLEPGWRLAHKTGTGQVMGRTATGFNDVGLLTAPDGHVYAVAVMIGRTDKDIGQRQALMAAVAQAVADHHAARPR